MQADEELRSAPPATLDVDVCRALDAATEFRAAEDDDDSIGTMVGNFSTLNDFYEIDSWFEGNFLERLAPGAFKRTIKNRSGQSPIRVLLEHGYDPNVGDKPLGVPEVLEERDSGAYAEVPLFDTSYNKDLMPALRGGAYGQSFRFRVLRDEWDEEPETSDQNPKGIPERTIKEVRLIEFGPTIFPANPATDAGLRSTTDDFYERLRRRDPKAYDDAVARSKTLRIPEAAEPTPQPGHSPAEPSHSDDPPERSVPQDTRSEHSTDPQEPAAADPPGAHSTPNKLERSSVMDQPMTVEERTARQSEIRARLAEIDTEHAGATLPSDVQEEWDNLRTEYDEHDTAVKAQEKRRDDLAARAVDNPKAGENLRNTAPGTQARRPENIYDLAEVRQRANSLDDAARLYRDNALRAVEQARFPGMADRAAAQTQVERLLDSVDDENGTLARRILVTGSPTYERAFGKAITKSSTDGLNAEEQRAMSLGSDPAGGYAVPFQLDPTVILTSDGVVDPLRSVARVEQIVGKEWQGVTSAGVTVTRAAEAAEVGDNSPTLDQPVVRPTRVHAFIPFSIEIDQDWTAMRSEMTRLLADGKMTEEADSFVNGAGTGVNPAGVVATLDAASVVRSNGGTVGAASFDSADIYALDDALPPRFRARARFLAAKPIYNTVRQFASADGADLWVRLAAGQPPELIGYPALEASEMSGTVDNDEKILLLGDFQQFLIVDRVGMSVELVPHLFHTGANRPTGQRGLYAIWRNSSKILVDNAFRLLQVNAAV